MSSGVIRALRLSHDKQEMALKIVILSLASTVAFSRYICILHYSLPFKIIGMC
uniref:Ovule protein n=1 Tax=Ascaris lumbricoides TaxID=6252 RepID=A0A0M3HFS7_ASCLU